MKEFMELITEFKELFSFDVTMGVITLVVVYVLVMSWHAKNKLQFKPKIKILKRLLIWAMLLKVK